MPQHNFWFFMEVIWARSQPSIWFYTEKARKEKKVKGSLSDHSVWNWEDKERTKLGVKCNSCYQRKKPYCQRHSRIWIIVLQKIIHNSHNSS